MIARSRTDGAAHRDGIYPHVKVRWHPLGKGLVKHMKPLEFNLEELPDELRRHRTRVGGR